MKSKIVLGNPLLDQCEADLIGNLIVREDYSVEIIPLELRGKHKSIKNACQIGISRE